MLQSIFEMPVSFFDLEAIISSSRFYEHLKQLWLLRSLLALDEIQEVTTLELEGQDNN